MTSKAEPSRFHASATVPLPRVAIRFCVQCKWNLRAAYYAQELLQTFSLSLGEVALIPSTSGTFIITLLLPLSPPAPPPPPHQRNPAPAPTDTETSPPSSEEQVASVDRAVVREHVIWDRKTEGGFPEIRDLKRRVRDLVEPERGLGHVDRDYGPGKGKETEGKGAEMMGKEGGDQSKGGESVDGKDTTPIKMEGMRVGGDKAGGGHDGDQVVEKCEDCVD